MHRSSATTVSSPLKASQRSGQSTDTKLLLGEEYQEGQTELTARRPAVVQDVLWPLI